MEVWMAVRYTRAEKVTIVPTLVGAGGNVADTSEEKAKMLVEMAFPPPVDYNSRSGVEGPEGGPFAYVKQDTVREAIFATSAKMQSHSARLTMLSSSFELGERV
jgi:hypothetical protein